MNATIKIDNLKSLIIVEQNIREREIEIKTSKEPLSLNCYTQDIPRIRAIVTKLMEEENIEVGCCIIIQH